MLFLMFVASQRSVCVSWVGKVQGQMTLMPILQLRQLRLKGDSLSHVK